jgi:hypothetical protein
MAALVLLEHFEDEEIERQIREYGAHIITLEGKRYLRVHPEDLEEDEDAEQDED